MAHDDRLLPPRAVIARADPAGDDYVLGMQEPVTLTVWSDYL